ncbi:PRTRC system protein F [Paraburkholderia terricola]|uniref:PRTRC system protein F n=1 Tax=Paraburkholderia terricola TaxID=169427 RepID=A0A1M6RVG0_9BURK|nr:PRTRC system protein F [Paraburkholderia sediminicola]SHK36420.1 PRTRC system protein F [Paraburkholderia terricola]
MSFSALALPSLDGIPSRYTVQSGDAFIRPFALALLDNGVITEADLARRPSSEIVLCSKALTRNWGEITGQLTRFDWNLRIEQDQHRALDGFYWQSSRETDPDAVWALIGTQQGPFSCAQVCVGPAIEYLESLRRGLGQTVLAALYDVLDLLPLVCTTRVAIGIAEYTYWQGYDNEEDAIDEAMAVYGASSKDELLANNEFVTARQIYGRMPRWVRQPKRALSRARVERAAKPDAFAQAVVKALDELWQVLQWCGPFADLSSPDAGAELVDFSLIVRWSEDDSVGRIIGDYGHYAAEGDHIPAASVTGLRLSDRSISTWLQQMRATAMLARAAERVLDLLGSMEFEQQQTLVRVFA